MTEIVLGPNTASPLTLTESDVISWDGAKTHTGKGDFRITIADTNAVDEYVQRKDRINININGTTKFTGYFTGVNHDYKGAQARLKGFGIGKRLEETRPDYASIGGPVTYSSTALDDAIRDYWSRTPFSNYTVYAQPTKVVTNDADLQSANTSTEWNNVVGSIPADLPVGVNNGSLELLQTCYLSEGENPTTSTGGFTSYSGYSGDAPTDGVGGAEGFAPSEGGTWEFNIDYTIPASAVGAYFRQRNASGGTPGGEWYLNGNQLDSATPSTNSERLVLSWYDQAQNPIYGGSGYTGGDLTPANNPHTLEWSGDGTGAGRLDVDVVALVDNRYSYNFDDAVTTNANGNNYLDGPELYPVESIITVDKTTAYNIVNGNLSSTWNNTNNSQQIELSNDGGATYPLSTSNSTSVSGNFPDVGRTAKVRFTLSRYGSQTITPANGYLGQSIDLFDFNGDLDNTVVIDSLELSRSHFENLQTLHDYGDYVWVIQHSDATLGNLVVESFSKGDQTKQVPDNFGLKENIQRTIEATQYYNSIYLEGAKDANNDRPTATQSDSTAISNDGREISPGVLRDLTITTKGGAQFRANALLQKALEKNAVRGSVTAAPDFPHPGYSYAVDLNQDGTTQNLTAETVTLRESNNDVTATYDFVGEQADLADEIRNLKRNAKETGNLV